MKTRIIFIALVAVPLAVSADPAFAQALYGMGMSQMGGGRGTNHVGSTGGTPTSGAMGGMPNGVQASSGGGSYGGGGGGGGSNGSGTIAGSYLGGAAALAQGLGQYNYESARAAGQIEEANHQAVENRLAAQQAYYEMRRLNKANWLADHPRSAPEQIERFHQSRLPRRLGPSELDPTWGVIRWPAVLERPEFDAIRHELDDTFAHRSEEQFGVGSAVYSRTQNLSRDLRGRLDEEHTSMSQMEWIQAMRFIESLAYETRFASGTTAGNYTLAK